MPKRLQKSLRDYLSRIKKATPNNQLSSNSFSPSKNWILSGCKQPKTLSFAIDRNQNDKNDAASLSDVDRFLHENFKSLYVKGNEDDKEKEEGGGGDEDKCTSGMLFESPRFAEPPPDLCGSHRFFVAPGSSGSLMEEARNSLTSTFEDMGSTSTSTSTTTKTLNDHSSTVSNDSKCVKLPDDSIAVLTYSPSPYDDFRRSMQEMVEARLQHRAKVDWDFMEELLFCYLSLNEKKSYKFILGAFVDLIIVLRQNSNKIPARSRNNFRARKRKDEKNET